MEKFERLENQKELSDLSLDEYNEWAGIQLQLDEILVQEEASWHQKSRDKWFLEMPTLPISIDWLIIEEGKLGFRVWNLMAILPEISK